LGEVRNVTISQSGGKWFASIQTQREIKQPLPTATSAIGIDVGITRFATMSDGASSPLNSFKNISSALRAISACRMSRKVKFSSNWKKAKAKSRRFTHHRQRPKRLPAQDHNDDQPKPRARMY
jgi:putative transposase